MSKIFRYYEFDLEGEYTVYVTDSWIVKHMIEYRGIDIGNMLDRAELILDFVAIHWAEEVSDKYLINCTKLLMDSYGVEQIKKSGGDEDVKKLAELIKENESVWEGLWEEESE